MREPSREPERRYTLAAARSAGYRALERVDAEMALRVDGVDEATARAAASAVRASAARMGDPNGA